MQINSSFSQSHTHSYILYKIEIRVQTLTFFLLFEWTIKFNLVVAFVITQLFIGFYKSYMILCSLQISSSCFVSLGLIPVSFLFLLHLHLQVWKSQGLIFLSVMGNWSVWSPPPPQAFLGFSAFIFFLRQHLMSWTDDLNGGKLDGSLNYLSGGNLDGSLLLREAEGKRLQSWSVSL